MLERSVLNDWSFVSDVKKKPDAVDGKTGVLQFSYDVFGRQHDQNL
jgi:hypothetical protein